MTALYLWSLGLGSFITHLGVATGLILLCGVGIWLIPSLKAKVILAFLAATILATMVAYIVGAKNEAHRNALQQDQLRQRVDTVVHNAHHPKRSRWHPNGVRDPWDQDWKD